MRRRGLSAASQVDGDGAPAPPAGDDGIAAPHAAAPGAAGDSAPSAAAGGASPDDREAIRAQPCGGGRVTDPPRGDEGGGTG